MRTETKSGFDSLEVRVVDWALSIKFYLFSVAYYNSYTDKNKNIYILALYRSQATFPYNLPYP